MFYAVDEALDAVSEPIGDFIEGARPDFIPSLGDRDPDMMVRKVLSYRPAAVSLVPDQSIRSDLWAASPFALYRAGFHKAIKRGRFMPLPGGKCKGDELAVSVCSQMNLGGVPALAVAERFALLPLFLSPEAC